MKILFTFFNPSGGMETLNRIRSKALMARGYECHLLYAVDGEGRKNIKGIKTFVTNDNEEIKRIIESEDYDIIVVCTDIHLLQKVKEMGFRGKAVFEIQGLGTTDTALELLKVFDSGIREYADALLYPRTSHLKQWFEQIFPAIPQFCFDDPLDTEHFGYVSYPPKPYPIIGWIGRIEQNKNWSEYLRIGFELRKQIPDLYLWMFDDDTLSDPSQKDYFEFSVRTLNLSERLIRYSNIPHELMADYLSIIGDSGGFLCSTSIKEGFGYAVAEAMLCRCPVLSTDSDGVKRFIKHNVTGKYYNLGDIKHAVGESLTLMRNRGLRNQIISAAEQHIKSEFSTSIYCDQFESMLSRITR
ncbi:glycosyltransferase family 4 protein [Paenibacillus sp. PDC88]|uniref:glycosyltransferase family 4 protein n=1 Tax=Paenibacillus TaxID=44249 RepID=UPI000B848256|nr:glycosyltransferase family 4 protein [Paenibacillus sp. PDC88]